MTMMKMRRRLSCLLLPYFLAFMSLTVVSGEQQKIVDVTGFAVINLSDCYQDLLAADIDEDGELTGEEYVNVAKATTPGLEGVNSYNELPRSFQVSFTTTACFCSNPSYGGNPEDTDCCLGSNAHVRIPTDPNDDDISTEDERYLSSSCSLLEAAAEGVLVPVPTLLPTLPPSDGEVTTNAPSPSPLDDTPSPVTPQTPAPIPPTPSPVATTSAPTGTPTAVPVAEPSSSPTLVPTVSPSVSPTVFRTPQPSDAPSITPQPTTTRGPSMNPTVTLQPSTAPTGAPSVATRTALVPYSISYRNGKNEVGNAVFFSEGLSDLTTAMNTVASEIASTDQFSRRLETLTSIGRRLEVEVVLPSAIGDNVQDIDCPANKAGEDDLCQQVESRVPIRVIDEDDEEQVLADFEAAVLQAVRDGELQFVLNELDPTSPVTVLESASETLTSDGDGDELTTAARAGIAIGALLAVMVSIGLLFRSRSEPEQKPDYEEYRKEEPAGDDPSILPAQSEDMSLYTDAAIGTSVSSGNANAERAAPTPVAVGNNILGASAPDYGKPVTMKDLEAMEAGEDIVAEPGHVEPDGSSNAGSSGWSSSAGFSSLNTGSMDESMDQAAAAGATLAGIGAASHIMSTLDRKPKKEDDGQDAPPVSRDQLDNLIEKGDWAAVGATAALLAAASDSQSASSRSRTTSRSRDSGSIDAVRAAELDQLVDAGDWEGVVLAAAKFQASSESASASDTRGSSLGTGGTSAGARTELEALIRRVLPGENVEEMMSQYRGREAELVETLRRMHVRQGGSSAEFDSMAGSLAGSGTGTGTGTGTAGSRSVTSASDTASKNQRNAEIRAEVEALVRRVVPEEIDNIDEMMKQFAGREEELVETLRTMHERSVAQKARATSQKAAKVQARQSVQRGVVPGASDVAQRAAAQTEETSGDTASALAEAKTAVTGGSSGTESPAMKVRSALEVAIEAGDWDAVGEAAAMMSDYKVIAPGDIEASAASSSSRSRRGLEGVNAARASQLDALIDQGDWDAVVAAANRFSESDKKGDSGRMSQEEQDALKQAELWMKIADQKKAQGATDAGASDAAEWAIQRSLNQMQEAERQMTSAARKEDYEEDEV